MPETKAGATRRLMIVLKGYPRVSETFIAQELYGLEQAGLDRDTARGRLKAKFR